MSALASLDINDWMRFASGAAWALAALYLTPRLWRSLTTRRTYMDPIWVAFWFVALNMVTYRIRAMYAPDVDYGIAICHAFALAAAVMVIALARHYADGR